MNTAEFKPEEKDAVFENVEQFLNSHQIKIKDRDKTRPWGGFFVINEDSLDQFISIFFSDTDLDQQKNLVLSPKILLVQPGKRLSWQYHNRRSEIWTIAEGTTGVIISDTDEETEIQKHQKGDRIKIARGQRHRLVGLDQWGIIAEIWQHTDPENPSEEEDIVRLQDDFGR